MGTPGRWLAGGIGVGLSLILVGPLLIPVPPLTGTVPPAELADPDGRFAHLRGLAVHYKACGEGDPLLLLLHGFGASAFSWRKVLAPLGELGLAAAYDRPAFGLTERPMPGDWPGDVSPYGPEAQVDLVLAMIEHLGSRQAILVGHSAGGALALEVAREHPEAVRALVLVSPAVYTGAARARLLRPLLRTPQARHLGPLAARWFVSRAGTFLATAYHDPARIVPADLEGYTVITRTNHWDRALWEFALAAEEPSWSPTQGASDIPILVLAGDDDRVVPTSQSVRLAGELPGSELVVVERCGHVPQEECPEEFLQQLLPFVARLR